MSYSSKGGYGAGDMALWVRMPAAFAQDLNSVSSMNRWLLTTCNSSSREHDILLASGDFQMHMIIQTCRCAHIHINKYLGSHDVRFQVEACTPGHSPQYPWPSSVTYPRRSERCRSSTKHPNLNRSFFFSTMTPNAERTSEILSWLPGHKQDQQMS